MALLARHSQISCSLSLLTPRLSSHQGTLSFAVHFLKGNARGILVKVDTSALNSDYIVFPPYFFAAMVIYTVFMLERSYK